MDPKIALEIFGYFGTALVILSFFMRDMKWLRIINIAGSLISLIYAIFVNTMPVALLNLTLIAINAAHLVQNTLKKKKRDAQVNCQADDAYNIGEKKEEVNT